MLGRKSGGSLDQPGPQLHRIGVGEVSWIPEVVLPRRRTGPGHVLRLAMRAADVPDQLADGPARTGGHRRAEIRVGQVLRQQAGLGDELIAVLVVVHRGTPFVGAVSSWSEPTASS